MSSTALKTEIINTHPLLSGADFGVAFSLWGAARFFSYLFGGSESAVSSKRGKTRKYSKRKFRYSKRGNSEDLGISVRIYSLYPFFRELDYFSRINNLHIR